MTGKWGTYTDTNPNDPDHGLKTVETTMGPGHETELSEVKKGAQMVVSCI